MCFSNVTVYCCSVLYYFMTVNLLLSLISKLNLIIGISVQEHKHNHVHTHIALVASGNHLRVLEPVFQGKGYSCNSTELEFRVYLSFPVLQTRRRGRCMLVPHFSTELGSSCFFYAIGRKSRRGWSKSINLTCPSNFF